MRRMYSEEELRKVVHDYIENNPNDVVGALVGKDISVEGITSKGIANTGGIANIGDVAISGDLDVQGEGKGNISATGNIEAGGNIDGQLKDGPILTITNENITKTFEVSRKIGDIILYQLKIHTSSTIDAGAKIGDFGYTPSSNIYMSGISAGAAVRTFLLTSANGSFENGGGSLGNNYDFTIFAIIKIVSPQP